MNIRRKHIRELCSTLLEDIGCNAAPVDVEGIARMRGVHVHRQVVEDDVSGFLVRDTRTGAAIIGVNKKQHPNRQRFTAAHELGHLLLHKASDVHVDRIFQVKHRNQRSSEGVDLEEMEANLFAAELLMPEHFLIQDLRDFELFELDAEEQIAKLAKKYGVSQQAMAIRLSSLGHLSV